MFSFSGMAFGSGRPVGVANVLVDFGSFFCWCVDRASGCIGPLPWSMLPYAELCDLTKKKKKIPTILILDTERRISEAIQIRMPT